MIRPALLALVLGIILTTSVELGVRAVPALAHVLFGLGLLCLAGSIVCTIWQGQSSPANDAKDHPRR